MRRDTTLVTLCSLLLLAGASVSLIRAGRPLQDVVLQESVAPRRATVAERPTWRPQHLAPIANIDPQAPAQPHRAKPYAVAVTLDGRKAYVSLAGKEIAPGDEVVVVDVTARQELRRITVGSMPLGLAIHPSGRWVLVTNRFSNYLSVIDTASDVEVSRIPVEFYCEDLAFSPDGETLYLSNFYLNQVLIVDLERTANGGLNGTLRRLDYDRAAFEGTSRLRTTTWIACGVCGYRDEDRAATNACARCGQTRSLVRHTEQHETGEPGVIHALLRVRCGTAGCHLYPAGGFVAGPDVEATLTSVKAHAVPHDPDGSPLLRAVTSVKHGGWGNATRGYHHAGGVIFRDPENDPDYQLLRDWIARGYDGPGIDVGDKPRDMVVSADGRTLYVANTGTLDISVIDLAALRDVRRIQTSSPVNGIAWAGGRLVLTTLQIGSGHPKQRDPGRESLDRDHPDAEFTLHRNMKAGDPRPLPLEQQQVLGPFDHVDGTKQEKFRDISNDVVLLDPTTDTVARYEANDHFTRYTSDSFESLPGDKKGDVPLELMKVVGAFPEQLVVIGDRIYVTMSGTFQVQEWQLDLAAAPSERLKPLRTFDTEFKPVGIAAAGSRTLVVTNLLAESLTFIDLERGATHHLSLSRLADRFPANDFERGEFFVQTSIFSVDQDQSCVHCHYRDTSDGKKWSVSQTMGQNRRGEEVTGGSMEVPDIRGLFHKVPFFLEGTLSMDEPLTMMMEHNPLIDFQGKTPAGDWSDLHATPEEAKIFSRSADMAVSATGKLPAGVTLADLAKRRDMHFRVLTKRFFAKELSMRDLQRAIGIYQGGEPRLLPNPMPLDDPMVRHGQEVFESPQVGCAGCHPAPTFTDKTFVYNQNKSIRPLVSSRPRDRAHHLVSADWLDHFNGFTRYWDPADRGRFEENEGWIPAISLHGLFGRPPSFLHHGFALNLREVVCTPRHPALRRLPFPRQQHVRPGLWELGLNELDGLVDTHGTTSHLSVWDIECLLKFLRTIE